MITQDQALEIAKETIVKTLFDLDTEFHVEDAIDCYINLYGSFDYKEYWCVYIHRPEFNYWIKSSEIVLVSKSTGKVAYIGSANDEG
jgi:hypothetical protein